MSETVSEVKRNLIPINEVQYRIGQLTPYLRGVDNNDLLSTGIENVTKAKIRPIPLEGVYRPHKMLKGEGCKETRFVFGIGSIIGTGGFSKIYHALDRLTGERCAAKVLKYNNANLIYGLESLQAEAELMTVLENDFFLKNHTIRVHDVALSSTNENGDNTPTMIIFEEYLDGDKFKQFGRLPQYNDREPEKFDPTMKILGQISEASERLFKLGHYYDLRASNILFSVPDIELKLVDFNGGYTDSVTPLEVVRYYCNERSKAPDLHSLTYSFAFHCFKKLLGSNPYDISDNFLDPRNRKVYKSTDGEFNTHFGRDLEHYAHTFSDKSQRDKLQYLFEKAFAIDPRKRYVSPTKFFEEFKKILNINNE